MISGGDAKFPTSTIGALNCAWNCLRANPLIFFLAALVEALIHVPFDNDTLFDYPPIVGLSVLTYCLLFYSILSFGADLVFLRGVRDSEVKISLVFSGFREGVDRYGNIVLAALLLFGLIGMSLMLFLVPGIYVACRLAFVSYLVADEGLDPIEAVEASWRLTGGHVLKILGLGLIAVPSGIIGLGILIVPVGIFGALFLGIGIVPIIMLVKAAFASMYVLLTQHDNQSGRS